MTLTSEQLKDIVLATYADLGKLKDEVGALAAREKRTQELLGKVRSELDDFLQKFDRDKYKSTEQRNRITSLATEVSIFDKLGYDFGGSRLEFLLGVHNLLRGASDEAIRHFTNFLDKVHDLSDIRAAAHYLLGMIHYNRQEYEKAKNSFQEAFDGSPKGTRDWQSATYVAELLFFIRGSQPVIERAFFETEENIKHERALSTEGQQGSSKFNALLATLYLKLGNCYYKTFSLEPERKNEMAETEKALRWYKEARRCCPRGDLRSLLPAVIDFSIAQCLYQRKHRDLDLPSASELFADVFKQLREVIQNKREEIILAQSYFMLALCTLYSDRLSKDAGAIYLEYARQQTISVPSDLCFFSCVTKELLRKGPFQTQLDTFALKLEKPIGKI